MKKTKIFSVLMSLLCTLGISTGVSAQSAPVHEPAEFWMQLNLNQPLEHVQEALRENFDAAEVEIDLASDSSWFFVRLLDADGGLLDLGGATSEDVTDFVQDVDGVFDSIPDILFTVPSADLGAPEQEEVQEAQDLSKAYGLHGFDVRVALVGGGVNDDHGRLSNRIQQKVDVRRYADTAGEEYLPGRTIKSATTHAASYLVGRPMTGTDFRGAASSARLVSARTTDDDGYAKMSDVVRALDWLSSKNLVEHEDYSQPLALGPNLKPDIVLVGLATLEEWHEARGCPGPLGNRFRQLKSEGKHVVVPAGDDMAYDNALSRCEDALVVASLANKAAPQVADFARVGVKADIYGLADGVLGAINTGASTLSMDHLSGSLHAATSVVATMALMLDAHPGLEPDLMRSALKNFSIEHIGDTHIPVLHSGNALAVVDHLYEVRGREIESDDYMGHDLYAQPGLEGPSTLNLSSLDEDDNSGFAPAYEQMGCSQTNQASALGLSVFGLALFLRRRRSPK